MASNVVSWILYFLIVIICIQCQPHKSEHGSAPIDPAIGLADSVDFSEKISVKYAQNFSIENYATHKIAHIHVTSEQRDISFEQKIVFYPRGQKIPTLPQDLKDAWLIEIPLQTVAANDDGEITRLSSLGLKNHIIAMGGGGIYDSDLRKRWEEKKIASIGYSFHQVPKAELSDGERQKIMVARALAQEPELMILDEVTAFLDLPRRVEIMQLLRKLAHDTGKAILLSTHDMDLALRSADRIWLLPKGGDLQVGAPEDLVLNGAFEEAFKSEGVSFNRFSGAFQLEQSTQKSVQLIGEGEEAAWTRRALEREGFSLQDQAELKVEVWGENNHVKWKLEKEAKTQEYDSIYQLISGIRYEEKAGVG